VCVLVRQEAVSKPVRSATYTDDTSSQREECLINTGMPFGAQSQALETMQPRYPALSHAAVLAQAAATCGISCGQICFGSPSPKLFPCCFRMVGSITKQTMRTVLRPPRLAAQRPNTVDQQDKLHHIAPIDSRDWQGQGYAAAIDRQVMPRPLPRLIGSCGARLSPPSSARTEEQPATDRVQRRFPCRPSSTSSMGRSFFQIRCQWQMHRQQVFRERPKWRPIAKSSVRTIPTSTSRSYAGGRPPWGLASFSARGAE